MFGILCRSHNGRVAIVLDLSYGFWCQVIYRIKLPGPAILGEGKPENQNHAIIFTRGEGLQTIDMNQVSIFHRENLCVYMLSTNRKLLVYQIIISFYRITTWKRLLKWEICCKNFLKNTMVCDIHQFLELGSTYLREGEVPWFGFISISIFYSLCWMLTTAWHFLQCVFTSMVHVKSGDKFCYYWSAVVSESFAVSFSFSVASMSVVYV